LIAEGGIRGQEFCFLTRSGDRRLCRLSAELTEIEGEACVLSVTEDVTERKQAEEALRYLKDFNEGIIQNMAEGVVLQDAEGYFTFVNPAAASLLGYAPEEVVGLHWRDITPPDQQPIIEGVDQLRMRGETSRYELEVVCRDGRRIPILVSGSPRFEEGRFAGTIAVFSDITERKQAEAEREQLLVQIQEQARRLQQTMDTVPEGVLLLDADLRVLVANPMAEEYLSALTGAGVGDPLTALDGRPVAEILTSPPKGLWHEVEAQGPPRRLFEVIARPMESGPETEGWVLVIRDATQERETQQYIQRQERLATVGQMTAGIAHDFNNIMATIVLYAQMLSQVAGRSSQEREQLAAINQQAMHATGLIRQVLDFCRRTVLERCPMDLLVFLKEQAKLLARTLPESIRIDLAYDKDEYMVNADPTRIQQAIINLAINARDAMPEGGTLCIGLEQMRVEDRKEAPLPEMEPGAWVRVMVSDTGMGIPPDVLPHVFDPFFTTKADGAGTGLGLAQVWGIVNQHKGHIDVTTKIGEGTTFAIYLPASETSRPESLAQASSALPQGQGETILVVEDNAPVREAVGSSLEALNYRVLEAADGREALGVFERHEEESDHTDRIALVVSDMVMPNMGGVALSHALREKGYRGQIIMLTGHPLHDSALLGNSDDWQSLGVVEWLPKPVSLGQLAEVLSRALEGDGGRRVIDQNTDQA
jgi:PAS domain S-box-containing protein